MNQEIRDYWNNKWVKKPITYAGRTLRKTNKPMEVDVKNFITTNDNILEKCVSYYGLRKATYNETAQACQQFICNSISYISDEEENGYIDFWQFPFETLFSRKGDCEDGGILMASLMIQAGIPNWRVKVAGGLVQESPTAPQGGHAYCIYLADRENGELEWEIHDWCYYPDANVPTGKKPLSKEGGFNQCYKEVWFTFNNEFSWTDELTTINSNRIDNI